MARAPSPETSPEVDFGAFLRPRSCNGVARPTSRPVSSYASYSAPRPVRPSPTQEKLGQQPQGRMRQGAPRLGGLGLGGLQNSPSPLPSPPPSPSKRKAAPQPTLHTTATSAPNKHDSATLGRPFLSPEMEKPTIREGAFALDRPVPDLGASITPPTPELPTPDSPSPTSSPFLGLSPPTSPTLDRLDALSTPDEVDGRAVAEEQQEKASITMDEVLGLVEAELMGQEEQAGETEMSSEETDADEEGSSLSSESEQEEELLDPILPTLAAPAETGARSPSPCLSVASLNSFHSLAPAQDVDLESSDSERSLDGPKTPPPLVPSALVAEAVVVLDEPTRSIDEVLLAGDSISAPKAAPLAPEMGRQHSTAFSDSSSFEVAPSPRSSTSRGTSRSTSRNRAPPPRPPRARRPPGSSTHTSPALSQRTLEDGIDDAAPTTETAQQTAPKEKDPAAEFAISASSSQPDTPLPSHSAKSSLSMSSQPGDGFFFVPPPPRQPSPKTSEAPTALQRPSSPVASGYEGLGLRLPSSLRPKSFYVDPEAPPMASSTRSAASPPLFSFPAPVAAPPAAGGDAALIEPLLPSTATPFERATTPSLSNEPTSVSNSAHPSTSPANLPSIDATFDTAAKAPTASALPAEDLSSTAEDDSGLADIGVAAVGALVTGGMAVGYSAWRGLSAAASAGWGWKSAAPIAEQATSVDEEEEEEEEEEEKEGSTLRLPGSLVQDEAEIDENGRRRELEEVGKEQTEVDSSVISTEWGEVAFPAPEGFIEAFKEAMAQLGPEDLAANEKLELDAQEAAHDLALQLHRESSGTTSSPATFSTSPPRSHPFPAPPSISKRASVISLDSKRSSDRDGTRTYEAESDEYDELMELVSPLFGTRVVDRSPASRRSIGGDFDAGRPLSRTLSGSTESSVSSRIPSSYITSSSPPTSRGAAPPPSTRKGSFFSFGKRRPSIDSSLAPPAPSSASTSSHRRAMSIDSGSSDSHDAAKLKRRSSLFGGSSIKSSAATLSTPIPISSPIESQIVDTTYVSYSSGKSSRRRNSSASTASLSPSPSSPPPLPPMPAAFHKTSNRRSSIRLESRYTTAVPPAREAKKIYTVRFANADRGIGLRSVAEDEALRAGGNAHAVKWVGVGRGNRYGNLLIQTDAESDEAYAEQVAEIKTKWRRFGGSQRGEQRDWTRVKID